MRTTILILVFIIMAQYSCTKKDEGFVPTLPPITTSGENTFGCLIDGKLLVPRSGTGTFTGPDSALIMLAFGDPPNYTFNEINVHDFKSENGGSMDIHLINRHENGAGNFTIDESNCRTGIDADMNINIRCNIWDETSRSYKRYCSIEEGGTLIISRYDYENKIISGTFSFVGANMNNPTELIDITDGRFDINWGTLTPYTEFP